jgi:hypothetical protein
MAVHLDEYGNRGSATEVVTAGFTVDGERVHRPADKQPSPRHASTPMGPSDMT